MNKILTGTAAILLTLAAGTMPSAAAGWLGFYAGANAGVAIGNGDANTSTVFSSSGYFATTSVPAISSAGSQNLNKNGFTGGAEAGFNFPFGPWVFGGELDFGALDLNDSASTTATYPCCSPTAFTVNQSMATHWLFTARPRIGWLFGNILFYGTGGLAVTKIHYNELFTDTFATAHESGAFTKTKTGWTLGAGVEALITPQWSVKGEWLYTDFGSETITSTNLTAFNPPIAYPTNVFTHEASLTAHIIRVGANFHF